MQVDDAGMIDQIPRRDHRRLTGVLSPEENPKRAGRAFRNLPAEGLSRVDQKGMKLVEERGIVGKMGHEEGPDLSHVRVSRNQAMTLQYPLRVGVGDEDGLPTGIQKNAVGCFGPMPGRRGVFP